MKKTLLIALLVAVFVLSGCAPSVEMLESNGIYDKEIVINRIEILNQKERTKIDLDKVTVAPNKEATEIWELETEYVFLRYMFDGSQVEGFFEDVDATAEKKATEMLGDMLKIFSDKYHDKSFENNALSSLVPAEELSDYTVDRLDENPQRVINLIGNGECKLYAKTFSAQGYNVIFEKRVRTYADGTQKIDLYFLGDKNG